MTNPESQPTNEAISFDAIYDEYVWPIASLVLTLRPLHAWAMGNFAAIKKGDRVIEIGACYGLYKLYSDKVGDNGLFVAVDFRQKIQTRAKKVGLWFDYFFKDNQRDKTNLVTANASKLPFAFP